MKTLSLEVSTEISSFINQCLPEFIADAKEYDGLDITFATDNDGESWNYQTGDNSFTGGCYSLPHWTVHYIDEDTIDSELIADVLAGLSELVGDQA